MHRIYNMEKEQKMINPIIDELEKNYKKSEIPQMNRFLKENKMHYNFRFPRYTNLKTLSCYKSTHD